MTTTPEETARHLRQLSSVRYCPCRDCTDCSEKIVAASAYFTTLASELAATKAELAEDQVTLRAAIRTLKDQVNDATRRAESAESRLGEIEQALEWLCKHHAYLHDDGLNVVYLTECMGGSEHDHDGTGPSVAAALLEAARKGQTDE